MSYDVASPNGNSSGLWSSPPATITVELRNAMQVQVADYAIRHGLKDEDTLDLIGMFGVLGDEMLPPPGVKRSRVA